MRMYCRWHNECIGTCRSVLYFGKGLLNGLGKCHYFIFFLYTHPLPFVFKSFVVSKFWSDLGGLIINCETSIIIQFTSKCWSFRLRLYSNYYYSSTKLQVIFRPMPPPGFTRPFIHASNIMVTWIVAIWVSFHATSP